MIGAASNKHDGGGWVFTICCCKFALTQFWKILELPIWVLDLERKFGFNGEEKLGGTKGESFDVNEGLLGVQRERERESAPWVPSRSQRGTLLGFVERN